MSTNWLESCFKWFYHPWLLHIVIGSNMLKLQELSSKVPIKLWWWDVSIRNDVKYYLLLWTTTCLQSALQAYIFTSLHFYFCSLVVCFKQQTSTLLLLVCFNHFICNKSVVLWRLNVWIKTRFHQHHAQQMSIGIYSDFLHLTHNEYKVM